MILLAFGLGVVCGVGATIVGVSIAAAHLADAEEAERRKW